jgi:hypothetical protein
MSALALSCLIFLLTLGGIFLGTLLRRALPEHHLSKDSQDVVRLGVGLIGTIAALVLGLLIAEARPIREQIRSTIEPFADQLWREKESGSTAPFEANAAAEKIYVAIQALSPQSDLQRSLQARAAQVSTDIAQTRLLLFVESDNLIPVPFLAILVFWLVIIFASFSLFSTLNVTVLTLLSLFALSASCAIFLILELSRPFTGLMMISNAPLRHALGSL